GSSTTIWAIPCACSGVAWATSRFRRGPTSTSPSRRCGLNSRAEPRKRMQITLLGRRKETRSGPEIENAKARKSENAKGKPEGQARKLPSLSRFRSFALSRSQWVLALRLLIWLGHLTKRQRDAGAVGV